MNVTPKILVGTLYSGENEFDNCLKSLECQNYTNWEQFILKNLPNKEAHERLYNEFMSRSNEFDLFLKLDADMVFIHKNALNQIVELFNRTENLDHCQFALWDWYSDNLIMGLHVVSNRSVWERDKNNLFVDPLPIIPGQRIDLWNGIAPFANHSPNPSPFQAYHFGVHRALKAFQYEEDIFLPDRTDYQLNILKKVWRNFLKTKDRRLGLAILGAEHVITKAIKCSHYDYTNPSLKEEFKKYRHLQGNQLYKKLKWKWATWHVNLRRFIVMAPSIKIFPITVFKKNI